MDNFEVLGSVVFQDMTVAVFREIMAPEVGSVML